MSTPNQPTPSLRELCAKATPGPWRVRRGTAMAVESRSHVVASTGGFSDNRRDPEDLNRELSSNAQLIARLSPDVALAVYEALETNGTTLANLLHDAKAGGRFGPYAVEGLTRAVATSRHALSLLDGTDKKGDAT